MDFEEYNGRPLFKVGFMDFCNLICRDEKQRYYLENKELSSHLRNTRYSKDFFVDFSGIKFTPKK